MKNRQQRVLELIAVDPVSLYEEQNPAKSKQVILLHVGQKYHLFVFYRKPDAIPHSGVPENDAAPFTHIITA